MKNLKTLADEVVAEMTRLGYSKNALRAYRHSFNQVIAFASSRNETNYSEKLDRITSMRSFNIRMRLKTTP